MPTQGRPPAPRRAAAGEPIASASLAQQVADRLRQEIHDGALRPGDRLDEQELADRLGVSRTPVREALRRLAAQGLVEERARRGCFVASLTVQDLQDIFPIMARLEGWVAHQVAARADAAALAGLEALHERLERLASAEDTSRYWDTNYDFHVAMQAIAGNRWLQELLGGLRGKLSLARHRSLKLPGRIHASLAEHRALMRALRRRRPEEAEAVMRGHLLSQLDAVLALEGLAAGAAAAPRRKGSKRPEAAHRRTNGPRAAVPQPGGTMSRLFSRRSMLQGLAALPVATALGSTARAAGKVDLKISHQVPGGTLTEGDFRDRLCRRFAAELEKRTGGAVGGTVYPSSSLMKTNAQFSAMRKGALDMSLVPLSYAGGEVAELNIGLMPGVVTSYEQGMAWKKAEVGKLLSDVLADKGVVIVSWIWQAGGVACRATPIVEPGDAKGQKVRGGSREMDMVLKTAGAAVMSLPSNEIYAAMQTGALDAAMTSSTSLMSFRLEEVSKALVTGRGKAYWFMFEPLMMSRAAFEAQPKDVQDVILKLGGELEAFGTEAAKADDQAVAAAYQKAGAKTLDLSAQTVQRWQAIARDTAWKDFAARSDRCAKLLAASEKVL
jgi:DNA-binding GntR family transcriptional regulator/TRAP-type C4-dicarboxylate transport system substrate-binding protein